MQAAGPALAAPLPGYAACRTHRNVSKFSQGTSVKDVSSYVDNALRYGKVTPNGPGGHVIEYNAGKVIGTNVSGAPTSTIKINVRDGVIQTAFPY